MLTRLNCIFDFHHVGSQILDYHLLLYSIHHPYQLIFLVFVPWTESGNDHSDDYETDLVFLVLMDFQLVSLLWSAKNRKKVHQITLLLRPLKSEQILAPKRTQLCVFRSLSSLFNHYTEDRGKFLLRLRHFYLQIFFQGGSKIINQTSILTMLFFIQSLPQGTKYITDHEKANPLKYPDYVLRKFAKY